MSESLALIGVQIPLELKRVLAVSSKERPFMRICATEPEHRAGCNYEGVRIDSFSTIYDENGKLKKINTSVALDRKMHYFEWHPDGSVEPNGAREIKSLTVFWESGKRVGIGEDELKNFLSILPQEPNKEIVAQQLALEQELPKRKIEREDTEISGSRSRI